MSETTLSSIRVPVDVVLGSAELTVEDLSRMTKGTLIELNRLAGEPIELRAGGEKIAEGEVIIIDEHLGLRVTAVTPKDT